jgi:SWI/SNF-related matrix-associated actin-dependent regulator 1 of chromatin subfamily A
MALSTNIFDAKCSRCPTTFGAKQGFYEKTQNGIVFYCKNCAAKVGESPASVPVNNTRRLTANFEIFTPKEPDNLPIIRAFPGARWTGQCWSVSREEGDRVRVLELADRLGLQVDPSLRTIKLCGRAEAAKTRGLYPFQVEGVDFVSKKAHALLGDQMGLGKTAQSLMSLEESDRVLAVVPASLKNNWRAEILLWRPEFKIKIIKKKTDFVLPVAGEIVIINRELLPDYLTPVKVEGEKYPVAKWPEGVRQYVGEILVIVDEAHKYKNWQAKCSKKMGQLSRAARKVIALTGTPLLNKPGDLFGVLSSVGMVGEVFGTWNRFKELFNAQDGQYGLEWGMPSPEVPERLRRVMLARRREEVLPNLPRKQYVDLPVDNTKSIDKQLDALDKVHGKLSREGGRLPPFQDFSRIRAEIAEARIPEMLEFVENCEEQEEQLVVFSYHLAPLDQLAMREGWAVISGDTPLDQRQQIVDAFQQGHLKGVGLTIQAGGVGLTLTAANKMLFVDMDWVPANNWQAEDRICRIGQEADKVTIYRMVSNHPLDRHVHTLLATKIALIEAATLQQAKAVLPT